MAALPRSAVQAAVWIAAAKQIGPIAAAVRPVPLAVRTIARSKEQAMTPEQYKAYREAINARARINYAKRKNKKDNA